MMILSVVAFGFLTTLGVDTGCGVETNLEMRVFDDGEAVRYVFPDVSQSVSGETTFWTLPEDARVWFQPIGGAYERPYTNLVVRQLPEGMEIAMPLTAILSDGTYVLLTEANVVDWPDGGLRYGGNGRFEVFYYAQTNVFVTESAKASPWRVTLRTKDANAFVTSDIVRRLCPDPEPDVSRSCRGFVKPGRCIWQWLPAGAPRYEEQKEWYDRTRKLGFEYYLVDDGWRVWRDGDKDQWACLKRWIDYGKSIGVRSFVWVDSKEMRTRESRRAYLDKVVASGAVGIKIDFIPPGSHAVMKWYEETLADTFDRRLMTDFHGAVKPTGRERTWPHEVAREAIRGHEWHITRYKRVLPPEHDCILPYHRLIQGHADYTPVVFEEKELVGYTWARELAQGVIFSAPFLCFGDFPANYLESPAVNLIKTLPPTYDEVRLLPGSEIGKCIAVAKRTGNRWLIAVENGPEMRRLEIPLIFLPGKADLAEYADADERPSAFKLTKREVTPMTVLHLLLKPCGGYVAEMVLVR